MKQQTQTKREILNKRGIMGLDTVKSTMMILLLLAVTAMAMFIALTSLSSETVIARTLVNNGTQAFINNTFRLNDTAQIPAAVSTQTGYVLSKIFAMNISGQIIDSSNYTVSGNSIVLAAPSLFNNTNINLSASYTYTIPSQAATLATNVSNGTTNFFSQIPAVFSILGAVVIILAVTLILYAVGRFSGLTGGSRESMGSGSTSGENRL